MFICEISIIIVILICRKLGPVWPAHTKKKKWILKAANNIICVLQNRSSCPEVFYKKDFLKSFVKFTIRILYWSHSLIKLQVGSPAILINSDTSAGVFL